MNGRSANGEVATSEGAQRAASPHDLLPATAGSPPITYTEAVETLDSLVDGVVAFDRLIAWAAAGRAEMVDAAVRWSMLNERPVERTVNGPRWSPETVAFRTVVSELATALRLPERTAQSLVGESRALVHDLPGTQDSLRQGRIGYRHAQVMIDHAMSVPAASRREFEDTVLPHAEELTVTKFDRKARRVRERVHPESIRERHRASVADRCVEHSPDRDGMAWIGARLPAPDVIGIWTRVTDIAIGLQGAAEDRTLPQLRADVFRDLLVDGITLDSPVMPPPGPVAGRTADSASASGTEIDATIHADTDTDTDTDTHAETDTDTDTGADGALVGADASAESDVDGTSRGTGDRRIRRGIGTGIRARVLVTVPVLTLLGRSDEPGDLEGYGPIDPDTARRLAAGASSFTRLLTHPESGVILSVGRSRYKVPKDLRNWLRLRDGTCRFPGCNRAAAYSDIDHTIDWVELGHTAHNNLAHLCRMHHSLKHQTAWRVGHVGNGALRWTSPIGRAYRTMPEVVLPARGGMTSPAAEVPPPPF